MKIQNTVAVLCLCGIMGGQVGCGEAKREVMKEVGPKALNEKYKWFKECLASLDAKKATIESLQSKIDRLREDYKDVARKDWASNDRESLNQWEAERDGVIASYNSLASEYNAAMAMFHTEFVNAGMLPNGGTDAELPRNVRNYIRGS